MPLRPRKRLPTALEMELRPHNGLPIALEMKLRPRNTIPNVFQAIISPSEYTTVHEKPQIPKNLGPSIH